MLQPHGAAQSTSCRSDTSAKLNRSALLWRVFQPVKKQRRGLLFQLVGHFRRRWLQRLGQVALTNSRSQGLPTSLELKKHVSVEEADRNGIHPSLVELRNLRKGPDPTGHVRYSRRERLLKLRGEAVKKWHHVLACLAVEHLELGRSDCEDMSRNFIPCKQFKPRSHMEGLQAEIDGGNSSLRSSHSRPLRSRHDHGRNPYKESDSYRKSCDRCSHPTANSGDTRPVQTAGRTRFKTWNKSRRQSHSVIPLWTRQHSGMACARRYVVRKQLDIFDHTPARMAAANRAAAERALHDVQFTATVRQERHEYYVGEAERWEHLAAHSARALDSKESQA